MNEIAVKQEPVDDDEYHANEKRPANSTVDKNPPKRAKLADASETGAIKTEPVYPNDVASDEDTEDESEYDIRTTGRHQVKEEEANSDADTEKGSDDETAAEVTVKREKDDGGN